MNYKIVFVPCTVESCSNKEYYFEQLQFVIDEIESYNDVFIKDYNTADNLTTTFDLGFFELDDDEIFNLVTIIKSELRQKLTQFNIG